MVAFLLDFPSEIIYCTNLTAFNLIEIDLNDIISEEVEPTANFAPLGTHTTYRIFRYREIY